LLAHLVETAQTGDGALMVWLVFAIAIVALGIAVHRQYKIFLKSVEGRDYYLGPKSIETDDPYVKEQYKKYLRATAWWVFPIFGLLFLVLMYVE
jgi:hypothetical protein